ncbi:MAG TPA: class I SAM-dependent methyltransferase [Candidatus Krumholzibacteria bacterium]|nr:class I SAM-dependent methyltransferase [Candidatus Krumholzibacteria bacterium]
MRLRQLIPLVTLVLVALVVATAGAEVPAESRNESYVDPDLDMQRMLSRLERETREVYSLRDEIVEVSGFEPGDVVADVGAGTGAFMDQLVEAVGAEGHLYAVEISIRFVEHLRERANEAGHDNVTTVFSSYTSATLPTASVDRIITIDTYHHFDDYEAMLASMYDALVPGGEMIVVDFDRVEGKSREWILSHVRDSKDTFRSEIEAAGFEFVEEVEIEGMVDNFFHRYRRP